MGFQYFMDVHVGKEIKGIFGDSNDIILWHESEDMKRNSLFQKFQLIPIFYVYKLCMIMRVLLLQQTTLGRSVGGHRPKTRKNSMKLGKNAKNRLKIKEKAEILAQEYFKKQGNQLKRGSLTPLSRLN